MIWSDFIRGIILLSLTGPGIAGNFLVFMKHIYLFVRGPEKKNIDLIIMHLAFSNEMTLCAYVMLDAKSVLHTTNFIDNIACKLVVYLGRVARGLSISTTCLLSVVQAITITPRTTSWTKLKPQTAQQVLSCLLLFWIFNTLISSNLLYYITAVNNTNRSETRQHMRYCYILPSKPTVRWLFLTLMALRDIIFQSLMGWSSGNMAFHLYTHHNRVIYLQSSRFTKKERRKGRKNSPEIRAAQNVLILMAFFLFFYWADFIYSFCKGSFLINASRMPNIKIFLELAYASLSPFVLISRISNWLLGNLLP